MIRLAMIEAHVESYQEAKRILAADFTSVPERKAALHIRDEFIQLAPSYASELVKALRLLIAHTDGEECADPESCNMARGDSVWLCSRCRLREIA